MKFVVGELEKKKNVFYIRLDRQDVDNVKIINPDDYQVGDIVKAEIVSYKPLEASIVERIGIKNDIGVDILTIAAEFDFSDRFPEEVVKELDDLPKDASAEAARGEDRLLRR